MRFKLVFMTFLLATAMLVSSSLSLSAERKKVLEVRSDGVRVTVRAENAGAEELLKKVARQAGFKLVTSGFPKGVKVDVYFNNLPLGKGIDRIVKALRKDASVSHIAMFKREGGRDVLYSLRVTYSKGTKERGKPAGPPPAVEKKTERLGPPRPPSSSKTGASGIETGETIEADVKQQMRQEISEKVKKQLRQEGWSEDEIMERIQNMLEEKR